MAESELLRTQRRRAVDIATELNLDGFENAEVVGRGGYGVVFRCDQPELDRIVAVKVLTADLDAESLQRLIREQRAMGRLSGHPHIVPVFQVGTPTEGIRTW
jgi:serine/threonine-protein kinase PknK